jgi:hypothetical protein
VVVPALAQARGMPRAAAMGLFGELLAVVVAQVRQFLVPPGILGDGDACRFEFGAG